MSDIADRVQKISVETNDFEELCASAEAWDQKYDQLTPGAFAGSLDLVQVGGTQIMRERWGRKVRYQGTAPAGCYGFALPLNITEPANLVGHKVELDSVVIAMPGRAADLIGCDDWDTLALGIAEEDVDRIVSALSTNGDFAENHEVATLRPYNAAALRRHGEAFLALPEPTTPAEAACVERACDQFVKLFVWEVVKAREDPELVTGDTDPAKIVRQATDYVLANPQTEIGLTELCEKFDLSLRKLHYVFRDVTGMSPATWLRRIRLNHVHKTLLKSGPSDILVKQVALDNGFFHFGHFTSQYQRLFGCLPSETLQSA